MVRLAMRIYRIKAVKALFPLAIVALVYREGKHELEGIHLVRTMHELKLVPAGTIMQMLVISLIAVSVMSAYDYLIRAHFQLKIGLWSTFRYSWIANTFNNILGFAGLAGVGLRTLLYKKSGVPAQLLTPAIVFLSPLMITGLSLLSWANITGLLPAAGLLQEHHWLTFAVWGMALYLPFFIIVQRSSLFAKWINRGQGRTPWLTVAASVGSSFLEWSFAGMAFWSIANPLLGGVSFTSIFSIYTVAAIAGILSMAPGGIGAFDLVALLGLTQLGYESEQAMAVLVIFRLFYYVIPWIIGLVLAALEIGLQGKRMEERTGPVLEPSLNRWQKIWRWPGEPPFLSDLGVWAIGKLVLASGLILLLSAATPDLVYRLKFTEELLPFPVMRFSHYLSVLVGFMLILLSRAVSLRIHRAYIWTGILLFGGALFAVTKGFDYEEAVFLLIVALILWISRARFYRVRVPFSRLSAFWWLILTSTIAAGYYWLGSHARRGFLKHLPPGILPEWLPQHGHVAFTAVSGLLFSWLLLTLIFTIRPERLAAALPDCSDPAWLRTYLSGTPGNALTHLLFLGDKSLFRSSNGQVLLPYMRVRDKLVVLGDPLGPMSLVSEGISELRQAADRYGLAVVFYQATPAYLPVYQEHGYQLFKLGEEALVKLDGFTLSVPEHTRLLSISNRFRLEGFLFEVAEGEHSADLLKELRNVSDEWLNGQTEKGFSRGWFKEAYLQLSPLALLRGADGRIMAFASLVPGYDGGERISIDLLRFRQHAPEGMLDYLLICLLEWSRSQGYTSFNLGLAPVPGASWNAGNLREEKLARLFFRQGSRGHGLGDFRNCMDRFAPEWEARYLVYPPGLSLQLLLPDLSRLVSRHPDIEKTNGYHAFFSLIASRFKDFPAK